MHRSLSLKWYILLLLTVGIFAVVAPAHSQSDSNERWQPPEPVADDFDWIRLNSGEWLKGRVKGFLNEILEFDSEKLDLLKIEYKNVIEFRIPHIRSFRFDDYGTFTGTAILHDGTITIKSAGETHELPRDKLIVVADARSGIFSQWSGKASLGFVGRSGNSDQADFNAVVQLRRQSPKSRLELNYAGNMGSVDGVENINNNNVNFVFDLPISSRLHVILASINYSNDRFQNIDHKYTLGAGFGFTFMQGHRVNWRVGLAGGRLTTEYISVEAGAASLERSATLIPSTSFEADITANTELEINYYVQIGLGKDHSIFHHSIGVFSVDVFGDILEFDLSITWDRVEHPKTDAEGNVLKKDDVRTSVGLGLQF